MRIAIEQNVVFGTPLAEYLSEQMSQGRIALVGDAAHIASPMVGAGFVSGLLDTAWRNLRIHWRNATIWPPSTR